MAVNTPGATGRREQAAAPGERGLPAAPGTAGFPEPTREPLTGRFRVMDWASRVYVGSNTLLLRHPNRPGNWPVLLAMHLVILAGVPLAIRFSHRHPVIGFLRDWYPLLVVAFLYNELRYLNRILTDRFFDRTVIRWEDTLFGRQLAIDFRRAVSWKIVGEAMHFGYFSYYFNLPALFVTLWVMKRYRQFRIALTVVSATYYFCYLWYVYFPVTGPYWQFRHPDPAAQGWLFPQLTYKIVSSGSSLGSAFPSSHIAASVAILGMAFRYVRRVFWILVVPVTLLSLGTVYGGFHYGVDALAGLAIGITASVFGPPLVLKLENRPRAAR